MKKSRTENSKTKLPPHGMSGEEALTKLVALFREQNLKTVAEWLGQMGQEALDYSHDKQELMASNQQQRMIGAMEILERLETISGTDTDKACGLILRLQ